MSSIRLKEVDYSKYCPKCAYSKTDSFDEPCDTCLEEFTNEGTDRPTLYKEKTK